MTTPKSVLIVGRSPLVLDTTVALLAERGYRASATNNFENVIEEFDATDIDVVVLGGQVPPHKKSKISDSFEARNPQIKFVQGLAGIPGLITDQAEAALRGEVLIPGQAPTWDVDQRVIRLSLYAPLEVKVTMYWITELVPPNPKSDSLVLAEDTLSAGEHTFAVPETVIPDAAFAAVFVGGARWSFRLSPATD